MVFEPIPRSAWKPEVTPGQAGGILKYRRLALLDSYVFWLIKVRRPPRSLGVAQHDLTKKNSARRSFRESSSSSQKVLVSFENGSQLDHLKQQRVPMLRLRLHVVLTEAETPLDYELSIGAFRFDPRQESCCR